MGGIQAEPRDPSTFAGCWKTKAVWFSYSKSMQCTTTESHVHTINNVHMQAFFLVLYKKIMVHTQVTPNQIGSDILGKDAFRFTGSLTAVWVHSEYRNPGWCGKTVLFIAFTLMHTLFHAIVNSPYLYEYTFPSCDWRNYIIDEFPYACPTTHSIRP